MLLFTDIEDKVLVFLIQAHATHAENLDETSPNPPHRQRIHKSMTISFQQQYFTGFYPPGSDPRDVGDATFSGQFYCFVPILSWQDYASRARGVARTFCAHNARDACEED